MSLKGITAGSGYDYMTRQVAAMDSTEKGHTGLASYYTDKGEVPGVWMGAGMAGIDGLKAGDVVTAEQMLSLFGSGHHPLAEQRKRDLVGPGLTEKDYVEISRLGEPFRVHAGDIGPFRIEVARRLDALNKERGLPSNAAVAIEDRARIRSQVALEMFRTERGRDPLDPRELASHIAKLSRQHTTTVAGFDATFSPVKSISALWAVADQPLAAVIERCHLQAVEAGLRYLEKHALYTRTGTNGVRQVDVRGLVASGFTHRDSRAGDPDLHTHVAIANKVQTLEGRWLSIDSRTLHKAIVAASETYNTALERLMADQLGVRFAPRPSPDPRKRPVREIVGVDPALNERWSTRRRHIEARRSQLVSEFQRDHHRPPTPVEAIALAQQATLETREAKHEPRTLDEQRTAWRKQAVAVLGSRRAIAAMVHDALHPPRGDRVTPDQAWLETTAKRVVATVQRDRSTWQTWHLRAEALRAVRAAEVPSVRVETVVDLLVDQALTYCRAITKPAAGEPAEPEPLRRLDGTSVYTMAGSQMYTSNAILAAEQRLVTAAGRADGRTVPATAIDVALLETEANGVTLNPGQVLLVREMASSGARLQLAIAPAGSGKTTAMNALSRAWSEAGGTVIGLAPSAAAASALGQNLHGTTDTLAKLLWDLNPIHPDLETWNRRIGPKSLVVIDEAGMADTLSLETAVSYILSRGGSVRLIGDDQQLASIGAGGVLRDIQATHGALHLTELLRFTDRAEGSATLALREGQPAALGFYLDQRRVHVGDQATLVEDLFAAWIADRTGGADSIMLAPTRELVAQLNQRARTDRLNGTRAGRCVDLPDGNQASAGDMIITRQNNRLLRLSRTDWVKNGDRFEVIAVTGRGAIRARHIGSRHIVTLPDDYVAKNVELGYACTTHTAQGVTADTMHGLLSGDETRQQAYTMLTRGRRTNHAYLVVVGDGDPHSLIRPDTVNPDTPTDLLERILARDESPISATTALRQAADPAVQLGHAAARYTDAIGIAATHIAGGETGLITLENAVDHTLPGLTDSPTWPALRLQLLLAAADGRDSIGVLNRALAVPLGDAFDVCTALASRIEPTHPRGPLPWLPHLPKRVAEHPLWGDYLTARQRLVADLAKRVRERSLDATVAPGWVGNTVAPPPAELVADVEVWRAATGVEPADQRPTGRRHPGLTEARWQRRLDQRLSDSQTAAMTEWRPLLQHLEPAILTDPYATILATRLSQLAASGINAAHLAHTFAGEGPLPDDHAAAALWWRIARHLTPAVTHDIDTGHHLTAGWLNTFTTGIGGLAEPLQNSPWWPALVTTIEHGLQRGWQLDRLIDEVRTTPVDERTDPCQAWTWRLTLLTDTPAGDQSDEPSDRPVEPSDLLPMPYRHPIHHLNPDQPPAGALPLREPPADMDWEDEPAPVNTSARGPASIEDYLEDDQLLIIEATIRRGLGAPEPTGWDLRRQLDRRDAVAESPVPPERLFEINRLAADYYQACFPGSWAQRYLAARFQTDLTGHPQIRPGYAREGWRQLTTHLRRHGITDTELLTAGLAKLSERTGGLYDRFRDRALFPIVHDGQILGFVGRRNPTHDDTVSTIPKYYNSPDTLAFHKGDQLFVAGPMTGDSVPVLVEGPMDAIAVTLTGGGQYVGVAPLGTSLTEQQAAQLRSIGTQPIVATDADAAGKAAAERDYWLMALYNLDPFYAALPAGTDPADLLAAGHPETLKATLDHAGRLADALIDDRLQNGTGSETLIEAVRVLSAQPAHRWTEGSDYIAERSALPATLIRAALAPMAAAWNSNPRKAVEQAIANTKRTPKRTTQAAAPMVEEPFETVTAPERHLSGIELPSAAPPTPGPGLGW